MEVRLRRHPSSSSSQGLLLQGDEAAALDRQEEGGPSTTPPPNQPSREHRSSSAAFYQHQNLMSPSCDRVFAYRSGTTGPPTARLFQLGRGEEEEEEDGGRKGERKGLAHASPSPADILRGPMRFGAGVAMQRSSSPARSKQQQQQQASSSSSSSSSSARRRSSLTKGCSVLCGLHLAPGDAGSIALLLVLYTLQGIPMGLSGSIPFLLQGRTTYKQQALFSLVSLPFSFKLLWAPVVDSTSFWGLGRRKAWLLPVQFLCGLMMMLASPLVGGWMGEEDGGLPNVQLLTAYFLCLYGLMATQDIAVDGWALTMLSRENVGLASTCNTIGQTLGM